MIEEGADIIDVGGESTRPGADIVDEAEELKRVVPVVEGLCSKGVAVSVDTTKAAVAEESLKAGAEIINDVSAMTTDGRMAEVVAKEGAGIVLMHMRGTPRTMQNDLTYVEIMGEIFGYLEQRLRSAEASGIETEKVAIDPGIGFGKSCEGNLDIIRRLSELTTLGRPIMLGTSRKSFISKTVSAEVERRLGGTLATIAIGVANGASLLRVHDVKQARAAADMAGAIALKGERGPAHASDV